MCFRFFGKGLEQGGGDGGGVFDFLNAALVQEAGFRPALGSAGDFATSDEDVVLDGILETGGGGLRVVGGGERCACGAGVR